jgi:hypothetical protein
LFRFAIQFSRNKSLQHSPVHHTDSCSAWQRPTLPGPCGPSTIGAGGLNGRVRDGNAWFPSAIITKRIALCCYSFHCLSRDSLTILPHPLSLCKLYFCSCKSRDGGAKRDRTADLLLARQALSQLSYGPLITPKSEAYSRSLFRLLFGGPRTIREAYGGP